MTLTESQIAEKSLIRKYGRKEHGGMLINIKPGGEDVSVWTPEMRKKMSEISSDRKYSKETRKKMSDAAKGKKKNPKSIEKMIATRRQKDNYKPSELTRQKMSDAKKGIPVSWTTDENKKKIVGKKISDAKKGIFVGDKKHLSKIQKNRKLVFNLQTQKRYWIDKNSNLKQEEIPAKIMTAIEKYNSGAARIGITGIKKKDLPTICEQYGISHLLKDIVG